MNMLSCLKNLKAYHVMVFPVTDGIVAAMVSNDIQLETLVLRIEEHTEPTDRNVILSNDYPLLLSSKPTHTATALLFNVRETFESETQFDTFSKTLGLSASNLTHLTNIEITVHKSVSIITSLFATLQHLNTLANSEI